MLCCDYRPTFYATAANYLLAVVARTTRPRRFTPKFQLGAIPSFATPSDRDEWEALSATCKNTLQKKYASTMLTKTRLDDGTRFGAVGRRRCLHFGNKTQ